jgi:hypothetical protein
LPAPGNGRPRAVLLLVRAETLIFAAGPPQGKTAPCGQQAEGAAWGHILVFRATPAWRAVGMRVVGGPGCSSAFSRSRL